MPEHRKCFPYGAGIRGSGTWRRESGRLEPLPGAVRNCMRFRDLACELPFDCVNLKHPLRQIETNPRAVDKFRIDLPMDGFPSDMVRQRPSWHADAVRGARGRDGHCWPPPAQIPACGATAPGSYLG